MVLSAVMTTDADYATKWAGFPAGPREGDRYEERALKVETFADELGRDHPLYYVLYGAADDVRHLGWLERSHRAGD